MTDTTGPIFIRGGFAHPEPDAALPPVDIVEPRTVVLGEDGMIYSENHGKWTARPYCGISERQQIEQQTCARERHDDRVARVTRLMRMNGVVVGILAMAGIFVLLMYLFTLLDHRWPLLEVIVALAFALGGYGVCDIVARRAVRRRIEREEAHAPEPPERLPDDLIVVPDEIADEARRRSGQVNRSVVA